MLRLKLLHISLSVLIDAFAATTRALMSLSLGRLYVIADEVGRECLIVYQAFICRQGVLCWQHDMLSNLAIP